MRQFPNEGLTFDDVSLVTQYADFLPEEAEVKSRLSRRVYVNMPFVSAAMDTVTEVRMAIAMAMLGGIGIIHRNLKKEDQAHQVQTVKRHLQGLIPNPVTFRESDTLETVMRTRTERGYNFKGFPVLDADRNVVGILTSTDIKFAKHTKVKVSDIMSREVICAPPDTSLRKAYEIMLRNKVGKLPLVKDGKLVGLYSFTDAKTLIEKAEPLYNRDKRYRLRVGAAIGPDDQDRVALLAEQDVDVLVVDTAHGHTKGVLTMVKWVKKHYPQIDVIGGNVATAEGALALREAGADAVKVGVGPGSICTTRVVAGVGVPQVSAIWGCARALRGGIPIIADGGIRQTGDVPKALAAGADTVMMGSALAGTDESPGEKIIHQGRQYVAYRGMGSLGALMEGEGSLIRYKQNNVAREELVPQGVEGIVPYAGTVQQVVTQFIGGLRASLGYCGCRNLKLLRRRGRFVRITSAGLREGHAHDVRVMKEAPNYRT
ncbi:MAG: IMP dehydrogenase [Kiritimatiellae bacterium]|nr:IMP dehydrogenase [Kiritimatiellia bacterium]